MKVVVCTLIRFYQVAISPVIHFIGGPASGCRFTPTCSEYALQAVGRYGALKGCWLGMKRICRCHPWGDSGHDPVPGVKGSPPPLPHEEKGHRIDRVSTHTSDHSFIT